MIDLEAIERSLRLRGMAYHGDVTVKIVHHMTGDGYGVETTVKGDRRLPVEDPMPIEEAIHLALAQIVHPRASYEYVAPSPVIPSPPLITRPYRSAGDLADEYKRRGLSRARAWDQFVIDTILQPVCRSETLDAREFYLAFDGDKPKPKPRRSKKN